MPSSRIQLSPQQEDQMTYMRTIQPSMATKMMNICQQTPIAFELVAKYVRDAMVECDGCGKPRHSVWASPTTPQPRLLSRLCVGH